MGHPTEPRQDQYAFRDQCKWSTGIKQLWQLEVSWKFSSETWMIRRSVFDHGQLAKWIPFICFQIVCKKSNLILAFGASALEDKWFPPSNCILFPELVSPRPNTHFVTTTSCDIQRIPQFAAHHGGVYCNNNIGFHQYESYF